MVLKGRAGQAKVPGNGQRFRWHIFKIKQHPSRVPGPAPKDYGHSVSIFGSYKNEGHQYLHGPPLPCSHTLYMIHLCLSSSSSSEMLPSGSLPNLLSILPLALAAITAAITSGQTSLSSGLLLSMVGLFLPEVTGQGVWRYVDSCRYWYSLPPTMSPHLTRWGHLSCLPSPSSGKQSSHIENFLLVENEKV